MPPTPPTPTTTLLPLSVHQAGSPYTWLTFQLGDVFIKNVLTVFSYSTNGVPAVGFQQLTASSNGAGATGTVQSGTGLPPGVPTGSRTGSYSFGGTGTASATSRSAAQSKIGGVSPVAALVGGTTVLLATLFGGLVV